MPQVNLTMHQLEEAVSHMEVSQRMEFLKKFSREALMARLNEIAKKVRKKMAQQGWNEADIDQRIEQIREEIHFAKQTRRST